MRKLFIFGFILVTFSKTVLGVDLFRSEKEIFGLWSVRSYNNGVNESNDRQGAIRFYPDKTFQITSGALRFLSGCYTECTGLMGTWYLQDEVILVMNANGYGKSMLFLISKIPGKKYYFIVGPNQVLMQRTENRSQMELD